MAHKIYKVPCCDGMGIYISLPPIRPSNQAINQAAVRTQVVCHCLAQMYIMSRRDAQEHISSFYNANAMNARSRVQSLTSDVKAAPHQRWRGGGRTDQSGKV